MFGQAPGDLSSSISSSETSATFSFFTVTPINGQAVLRWAAPPLKSEDFFIVEKSNDAQHFETLSAMNASVADSVYSLVDNTAGNGTNFYRIRISGKDGQERYSKTVSLRTVTSSEFRFYPNPVDKLLIIRSPHPLSVKVTDVNGATWFSQDVEAGMQIINVSILQKGNYILNATDKSTNTVISEQLVKNN
jgi:hypothetical protein